MICPACQTEANDSEEVCFNCRAVLTAVTAGTLIAGRYEVICRLGRGGMGTVYRAHDRELDEHVALKILRSDLAQSADIARRFRSEIKLARRIGHRNVCRIFEYGQDGELRFIAMELVEGTELKTLIRNSGPLPWPEAFDLSRQIADGLGAIHELGIVHRDLKTSNVMVDVRGVIRVMDFGIAKRFETATAEDLTATGQVVGTPEYMSPEQARGQRVDARSDIYSLGIVIFEIFTGSVPFRGDTPVATLLMHLNERPPLKTHLGSRLPLELHPILETALAKNREERYPSALQMAAKLRVAAAASAVPPTLGLARNNHLSAGRVDTGESVIRSGEIGAPTSTESVSSPSNEGDVSNNVGATAQTLSGLYGGTIPNRPHRARAAIIGLFVLAAATSVHFSLRSLERPQAIETNALTLAPAASQEQVSPSPAFAETRVTERATVGSADSAPRSSAVLQETKRHSALVPKGVGPRVAPETTVPAPAAGLSNEAITLSAPIAPASPEPDSSVAPTTTTLPATKSRADAELLPEKTEAIAPSVTSSTIGTLHLVVIPYAELTLDDRHFGRVTSSRLRLTAGMHVVALDHPDYQRFRRPVVVVAGEMSRLVVDLSEEAVKKKN